MKEISASSILKEAKCRISDNNLIMTRDGELYRIGKVLAVNGKETDGILIDDNTCENEAKSEFLRNYIRSGRLKGQTKKNILAYIRKLENDTTDIDICKITNSEEIIENTTQIDINSSLIEKHNYKENNLEKLLNDFKYTSSKYDIEQIIGLVVESRIKNISPYSPVLTRKYNAKTDGTVYGWYRDLNEYRILYTLYSLDYEDIKKILINYSNEEIKSFEEKLKKDISNNFQLDEYIKEDFYDKINIRSQNEYNDNISDKTEIISKNRSIDIIDVLTQNEQVWDAFANSNKDKIFDILYNDKDILNQILTMMYK